MGEVRGNAKVVRTPTGVRVEVDLPSLDGGGGGPPPAVSHGADFAAVRWAGTLFEFSPRQRSIVAALFQARDQGHEWVTGASLLELADCNGGRVRDLFKGHPAWGTLIVSAHLTGGPAGSYRVAEPG